MSYNPPLRSTLSYDDAYGPASLEMITTGSSSITKFCGDFRGVHCTFIEAADI